MTAAALLPTAVMLPMAGAALTLILGKRPKAQRIVSVSVLILQLVVEISMLLAVDANGTLVVQVGGWSAPFGITLVADRLATLMLVVSTTVTLAVLIYAISADHADGEETDTPVTIFHPAFLILATGVSNAFLAGDLFNLFVSFEILLTASYVLITSGGTMERLRDGAPYVVVSLLSSIIFLSGIALVYTATGTVNLADLAGKMAALPVGIVLVLQAMLLVAFGVKAAIWPMQQWLPDSYPTAPAPVTAVFAGLLTKVGVYAIIRVQTLLFPGGNFDDLLMIIAAITMVIGILGALAQAGIKRMLSFTLVSHIGYMLFGVAAHNEIGLAASIFYVMHHILVQTALFLAAGLIERVAGTTQLSRLSGLAAASPLLAVLFFVPAMNLAGVPPFSGFLGKVGLFEAGVENGSAVAYVVVGAGALTSLLTLYTILRVWGRAFWRPDPEVLEGGAPGERIRPGQDKKWFAATQARRTALRTAAARLPLGMLVATTFVVAVTLVLTVVGGPIYGVAERAAENLGDRNGYITAVFGADASSGTGGLQVTEGAGP
ncbi:Na+/H+ antiporter subunit D [Nakamurella sp. YIM 132087]|uniref:Na+/H+ antiporter subunit D n=1 Tax=Nakamurella alba TaxID=2665158 RepID=A0A7K1FGL7_9ACTN|nr:Na+/H+ antiporter subunit D [Nakamurella alba]MTD13267.1 Na+/H+ antiporter subunit D [Nakamurella alba]